MENHVVNNPEVTPQVPPVENPVVPAVTPEVPPTQAPGSKTESELLLKSLQEERDKRRQLEAELEAAKTAVPPASDDVFSDEGKAILEKYVQPLSNQVKTLEEKLAMEKILGSNPALKDKLSEFNEFRSSRQGYSLEDTASLFLSENGLTGEAPKRKGLEKLSGGARVPTPQGLSKDDIENLRKNDYKKYKKLLMEGKLEISN